MYAYPSINSSLLNKLISVNPRVNIVHLDCFFYQAYKGALKGRQNNRQAEKIKYQICHKIILECTKTTFKVKTVFVKDVLKLKLLFCAKLYS